jgi:hypothetical protein
MSGRLISEDVRKFAGALQAMGVIPPVGIACVGGIPWWAAVMCSLWQVSMALGTWYLPNNFVWFRDHIDL